MELNYTDGLALGFGLGLLVGAILMILIAVWFYEKEKGEAYESAGELKRK